MSAKRQSTSKSWAEELSVNGYFFKEGLNLVTNFASVLEPGHNQLQAQQQNTDRCEQQICQ